MIYATFCLCIAQQNLMGTQTLVFRYDELDISTVFAQWQTVSSRRSRGYINATAPTVLTYGTAKSHRHSRYRCAPCNIAESIL